MTIKEKVLKDNICKLHPITSIRAIDLTLAEVGKVIDRFSFELINLNETMKDKNCKEIEKVMRKELKKEIGI